MEIINLQNINIETLPVSIKTEFEKIYFEFNNTEHKPIYIHSIINTILNYKNNHILLNDYDNVFTDEHFIKYSNMYNTGFNEGYLLAKEYIDYTDDIKIKTDRVFGGIYKKFSPLKETYTFLIKSEKDKFIFDEMEYYNHAIEVGKYVMYWDYVLNNYYYFIEIFDFHFLNNETEFKRIPPTVPATENSLIWNGTQTEFIELVKALIENGSIKGTQTEIITKLSNVFNIEIKYPNKLITDIKKRNNDSETLFLDKLKKSLFDYITLEKKK